MRGGGDTEICFERARNEKRKVVDITKCVSFCAMFREKIVHVMFLLP